MSDKLMTDYRLPENTPEQAPLPGFNPQAANFFDLFAPQYYNLETVQALMQEGGGPLLRQVDRIDVEYVYNPERGEDSGEWKPVVHFTGSGPSLVVNQTRAKVLMQATSSIHVNEWRNVGWLEISAGIENGNAQIVIKPTRDPESMDLVKQDSGNSHNVMDAVNEDLFG